MIIYKTINLINGKFYIGKDSKNNPDYFGSGIILKKAIKKYGKENFKKEILEYCNSEKELDQKEIFWIKKLNSIENGYNIALGGTGGDTFTNNPNKEKIIQNLSQKLTGGKLSEKTRKNMSNGRKGMKFSEEHKQNISKAQIGIKFIYNIKTRQIRKVKKNELEEFLLNNSDWKLGKGITLTKEHKEKLNNSRRGIKSSNETKQKISQSKKGIKLTEKHKQNISIALTGIKLSNEHRKNMSISHQGKKRKPFSEETKKKMSKAAKNRPDVSDETKQKLSEANKGRIPWNKGIHYSKNIKENEL